VRNDKYEISMGFDQQLSHPGFRHPTLLSAVILPWQSKHAQASHKDHAWIYFHMPWTKTSTHKIQRYRYGGFLSHRSTPSHHPLRDPS
jgi:hypothetical protein